MNKYALESILFVSKEPAAPDKLAKLLDCDEHVIYRWIAELEKDYEHRGIKIRRVAGGFEMVSSEEFYSVVENVVKKEYQTLSKSVLETVTLIAMKQPVNKATIARFRGVKNPDNGIDGALNLKLIIETDKGFITTPEFLRYFGINDLKELEEKLSRL